MAETNTVLTVVAAGGQMRMSKPTSEDVRAAKELVRGFSTLTLTRIGYCTDTAVGIAIGLLSDKFLHSVGAVVISADCLVTLKEGLPDER
jgi:hypothetical protein